MASTFTPPNIPTIRTGCGRTFSIPFRADVSKLKQNLGRATSSTSDQNVSFIQIKRTGRRMQMDANFRVLPGRRVLQKKKIKRLTYHEHFRRFQNETFVGSSNADAAALAETVTKDEKTKINFHFLFPTFKQSQLSTFRRIHQLMNQIQIKILRDVTLLTTVPRLATNPDIPLTNELTFIQSSRM